MVFLSSGKNFWMVWSGQVLGMVSKSVWFGRNFKGRHNEKSSMECLPLQLEDWP